MSGLTRDGTAESVSRDQLLRRERGQGNIDFPCLAGHEQDWQPYPVDAQFAERGGHTYIHTHPLTRYAKTPRAQHGPCHRNVYQIFYPEGSLFFCHLPLPLKSEPYFVTSPPLYAPYFTYDGKGIFSLTCRGTGLLPPARARSRPRSVSAWCVRLGQKHLGAKVSSRGIGD